MSFIAFDLDALNRAPAVARAAGIPEEHVLAGLLRLWAWCFREETDQVTALHVRGHFGADCSDALVAFGFLELSEKAFRVRGAARYLRVKTAQRDAAKRTNQRRALRAEEPRSSDGTPSAPPSGELTPLHRTPNTEHRTPNTDDDPPLKAHIPVTYKAPTSPAELWTHEDFFAWAQAKRQEAGFVGERDRPPRLGAWYSAALMTLGGSVEALQEAFYRFGEHKHWQQATPPLPFRAFVAQWDRFVPRGALHAES